MSVTLTDLLTYSLVLFSAINIPIAFVSLVVSLIVLTRRRKK